MFTYEFRFRLPFESKKLSFNSEYKGYKIKLTTKYKIINARIIFADVNLLTFILSSECYLLKVINQLHHLF